MAALKMLVPRSARVCRGGQTMTVPTSHLILGDISIVEAGDLVPADLRLIETSQLRVDEAALTGESVPVEKHTASLTIVELPVGDRLNMAYKGTVVTYSRATGVVIATGMATELGKIAGLLQKEEAVQTPLQKRLARFGQRLAFAILAICLFVFVFGVLRGEPGILIFLTAVSLAVAAIPDALPAVVTISLALGAHKMVKKKCPDPATSWCGNLGVSHLHLFRQDRNSYPEQDAGGTAPCEWAISQGMWPRRDGERALASALPGHGLKQRCNWERPGESHRRSNRNGSLQSCAGSELRQGGSYTHLAALR